MNATQTTVETLREKLWDLRTSNAPYAQRVAVQRQIEAAQRSAGPVARSVPAVRKCCAAATVSYNCTCSYVTTCAQHGTRHHGTHD